MVSIHSEEKLLEMALKYIDETVVFRSPKAVDKAVRDANQARAAAAVVAVGDKTET